MRLKRSRGRSGGRLLLLLVVVLLLDERGRKMGVAIAGTVLVLVEHVSVVLSVVGEKHGVGHH